MEKLPNKWCIRRNHNNYIEINKYFNSLSNKGQCYSCGDGYIYSENMDTSASARYWPQYKPEYTLITFEDFERFILNRNKKIIGYKVPMDLFGGRIPEGEVVKVENYSNVVVYIGKLQTYHLPKEIVERWEPVYEEEEKRLVLANTVYPGNKVFKLKDGKIFDSNGKEWEKSGIENILEDFQNQPFPGIPYDGRMTGYIEINKQHYSQSELESLLAFFNY